MWLNLNASPLTLLMWYHQLHHYKIHIVIYNICEPAFHCNGCNLCLNNYLFSFHALRNETGSPGEKVFLTFLFVLGSYILPGKFLFKLLRIK